MRLEWSRVALDHLRRIRDYIASNNPSAAADVAERLLKSTERLESFPESGRAGRLPHTRELVVSGTPYIIVYRVVENVVEIAAVVHGAREWPENR